MTYFLLQSLFEPNPLIVNLIQNKFETKWGFFPLWLGYILTVDALVFYRRGGSWFTSDIRSFALLFLFSAPNNQIKLQISDTTHSISIFVPEETFTKIVKECMLG